MSLCVINECPRGPIVARGLCQAHYRRWQKYGDPLGGGPMRPPSPVRQCSCEGCTDPVKQSGLCSKHFFRAWRQDRADAEGRIIHSHGRTVEQRLLDFRSIGGSWARHFGPHWVWTGAVKDNGYGVLTIEPGGSQYVHRLAHKLWVEPIPEGWTVDHLCRVRLCFQPLHLEAVTQAENYARGQAYRRIYGAAA